MQQRDPMDPYWLYPDINAAKFVATFGRLPRRARTALLEQGIDTIEKLHATSLYQLKLSHNFGPVSLQAILDEFGHPEQR